jgi:EpsI family protein
VLCIYWPTTLALWNYWVFLGSQGVLILVLSAWLMWRARFRIMQAPVQPRPWLVLPLVLCSIVSLVFWKAGIQALDLLLLPFLLLVAVVAAFGSVVLRAVAVPVLYLYFAMPGWNFLSVPLQNLTLGVVRWVSPIIGLPATVSGSTVAFPNGTKFEVTLACSGIGFLVQALAIAVLLGELEQASLRRRIRLAMGAGALALVANWVRALAILQIGYSTNMRSPLASSEHLEFGYVLFVVALVIYVWIATRNAPPDRDTPRAVNPVHTAWRVPYVATLVALAIAPLFVAVSTRTAGAGELASLALPEGRGEWSGPRAADHSDWNPKFVGTHDERHVVYSAAGDRKVEVVGIGYERQEQGRELVNEDNSILGEKEQDSATTELVEGEGVRYLETIVIDQSGQQFVMWSFYDIGGRTFVAPLMSQLWYGVHSLKSTPYSALIALRTACDTNCAEARATLLNFVSQMGPSLVAAPAAPSTPHKRLVSGAIGVLGRSGKSLAS